MNAWDFSFYDRPLAHPFESGFLFNRIEGRSLLGTHAYYGLLLFLPAYALHSSPYWLIVAQAFSIAAACIVAFHCFRILCRDDLAAALLAVAFLLNDFTAKAVQYVFHPEIFYPACLFLLMYAFLARRPLAFAIAVLATAAVKEDALLPLLGFAMTASLCYRRYRWAAAAAAIGLVVFLVDYLVVLPHFAGQAGPPWYAHYWAKYGSSPPAAALGMLLHPLEVASDLLQSGFWRLAGGLAFVPLLGFEWLLAAAAVVVPYGSAQVVQLSRFRLYYAMPVLPFLFAAAAAGLHRIVAFKKVLPATDRRARYRTGALAVLLVSAFYGPGYRFVRRQPTEIPRRLASTINGRPLVVQGALLPHVGYSVDCIALQSSVRVDASHGFLVAPGAIPYPLTRRELQRLAEKLTHDPRFHTTVTHGILLAVPVAWGSVGRLTNQVRPLSEAESLTDRSAATQPRP